MSLKTLLLLITMLPTFAFAAGKVDVLAGAFSINAKSGNASSSVAGLGAYMLDYRISFWSNFDLIVGYSIDASKGIGGDLAFGPDFGILYFPLTHSDVITASSDTVVVDFQDHIKPYVGGSFHQRQYQSTNSTYAGFGGSLGSEFNFWKSFSVRAEIRDIVFAGPSGATANEINALVGFTFRTGK